MSKKSAAKTETETPKREHAWSRPIKYTPGERKLLDALGAQGGIRAGSAAGDVAAVAFVMFYEQTSKYLFELCREPAPKPATGHPLHERIVNTPAAFRILGQRDDGTDIVLDVEPRSIGEDSFRPRDYRGYNERFDVEQFAQHGFTLSDDTHFRFAEMPTTAARTGAGVWIRMTVSPSPSPAQATKVGMTFHTRETRPPGLHLGLAPDVDDVWRVGPAPVDDNAPAGPVLTQELWLDVVYDLWHVARRFMEAT